MLFNYQCREPFNDGDNWHDVDAEWPDEAAELYAETCNSDGDATESFAKGVVIEVRDSEDAATEDVMRFTVTVEFEPQYSARELP